jgi:hypothetical protein
VYVDVDDDDDDDDDDDKVRLLKDELMLQCFLHA